MIKGVKQESLVVKLSDVELPGVINFAENNTMVLFAHGSGSSHLSPRNIFVAQYLAARGIGTFLFDLLTEEEDRDYSKCFEIDLIKCRLISTTKWLKESFPKRRLSFGYFGASTGAAAALLAAAELQREIKAVVCRGGRTDLAADQIFKVLAPTLLIVGEYDPEVVEINQQTFHELRATKKITMVPGATHLFEEEGALEAVSAAAAGWFEKYL